MEMKHYIVKKKKESWVVMQDIETANGGYVKLISAHPKLYDAWKEARRLARGAGGKATLNGKVMNIYAHDDE